MCLCVSLFFVHHVPASAEPGPVAMWDFESGTSGWRGVGGVGIGLANPAAAGFGSASLHASGTTAGGTVLESSWPGISIRAKVPVQIAGFLRAGACSGYVVLKATFLDRNRKLVSSAISNTYDSIRCGTWQELFIGTQIPESASTVTLSVVQAQKGKVDFLFDNVIIRYTDRINPLGPLADTPIPPRLQSYAGRHPRLFLTIEKVAELRKKMKEEPYRSLWTRVRTRADAVPPLAQTFPVCGAAIKQRELGNELPRLAFVWLLTQERSYLYAARAIATQMIQAPAWGMCSAQDRDHVAGVVLLGLSIYYDWCYDEIDPQTRDAILKKIHAVSSTMATKVFSGDGDVWWKDAYLCNQMPVALAGLAAAGYATFDQDPDGSAWIQLAMDKIENLLTVRADDGAYIEGIGYWGYDLENLLKLLDLFDQLSGVSLYRNSWLQNTAMFRLYMGLPRKAWTRYNQVVDLNDSVRVNWYGPDTILRCLAREYKNPYAQWLAGELSSSNYTDDVSEWLNLLWLADDVAPVPPTGLPTSKLFPDIGIVSARSDWSGNESLVVYAAGPQIGHKALRFSTASRLFADHMHPHAGHFIVFACGEWQIRDDGYWADDGSENPKMTENHNTLVIDGLNQLQTDETFAQKAEPSITGYSSDKAIDFIKSDLHQAYRADLGLKRFLRYVIFMKPDILIVIDDVELSSPHALELIFHPQNAITRQGEYFVSKGDKSGLRIGYLPQEGVQSSWGNEKYSNGRLTMPTLRLKKTSNVWKNATVLTWSKSKPPVVEMKDMGKEWRFSSGNRTVTFDWEKKSASFFPSVSQGV